jgi:hypothetical protein
MSVTTFCDVDNFNAPTWRIKNETNVDMREPRNFWLLIGLGDDDSCVAETAGRPADGSFFLRGGEFLQRPFNLGNAMPQKICAQQSPGPLRRAFASAVIGVGGNPCATGLPNTPEPPGALRLFFPWAGR